MTDEDHTDSCELIAHDLMHVKDEPKHDLSRDAWSNGLNVNCAIENRKDSCTKLNVVHCCCYRQHWQHPKFPNMSKLITWADLKPWRIHAQAQRMKDAEDARPGCGTAAGGAAAELWRCGARYGILQTAVAKRNQLRASAPACHSRSSCVT